MFIGKRKRSCQGLDGEVVVMGVAGNVNIAVDKVEEVDREDR
jgi:hypothetical protein